MTDILTDPPLEDTRLLDLEPAPDRKRWTRKECEFLEQNDLLIGRYELINGDIISKMGQNLPHKITVMLITLWIARVFGDAFVQCQMSVGVDLADAEINAPEPDIAALHQPLASLPNNEPTPENVALLVEVSASTLRFDLRTKALLYARAGIADYWIADIGGRCFVVHRSPTPTGYTDVREYGEAEMVSPLARPDLTVRVSDLLPPSTAVSATE